VEAAGPLEDGLAGAQPVRQGRDDGGSDPRARREDVAAHRHVVERGLAADAARGRGDERSRRDGRGVEAPADSDGQLVLRRADLARVTGLDGGAFVLDTPGIVHAVTAVLRSHGVNIEDLETDTGAAPWTGAPMFRMKAHLVAGPGVSIPRLREELAKLQERHDLDISLKPVFPLPEGE